MSDDGYPRVLVNGDIDFHTASEITQAVSDVLDQGHKRVDICLSDVEFMDSTGISALLNSAKLARDAQARLVLVSPTRQLLHILETSGFQRFFEFVDLPGPASVVAHPVMTPINWQISEFSVPCHPELVSDIRRRVAEVATSLPFTAEQIEDIKLGVGEAAANAYRHGCPSDALGTIHVRCVGDTSGLTIEITDYGPGFDPHQVPVPVAGNLECGGRGIFFMQLSMDEVGFERLTQGMRVRMVKYLHKPA